MALTVAPDPELGPDNCSSCGRPIVWALTDRDVRVPLEQVDPHGDEQPPAPWWVCGMEGEELRARMWTGAATPTPPLRWVIHWPAGKQCARRPHLGTPLLGVLPGGRANKRQSP